MQPPREVPQRLGPPALGWGPRGLRPPQGPGPLGWSPAAAIPPAVEGSAGGPAERVPSPAAILPLPSSATSRAPARPFLRPRREKAPPAAGQPGPARSRSGGSGRLSPARRGAPAAPPPPRTPSRDPRRHRPPPPPPALPPPPPRTASSRRPRCPERRRGRGGPGSPPRSARRGGCPGRTHRPALSLRASAALRPAQRGGERRPRSMGKAGWLLGAGFR